MTKELLTKRWLKPQDFNAQRGNMLNLLYFILACSCLIFEAQAVRSTRFINLSLISLKNSEWNEQNIQNFIDNTRQALKECDIEIDNIEIRSVDGDEPTDYQSIITNSSYYLNLVKSTQPLYRPAVYLTNRQSPSIGLAIPSSLLKYLFGYPENQDLLNTIWVKHSFWKEVSGHYHIITHEIGHLLGLEHVEDNRDIMYGHPIPIDAATPDRFTPSQCKKMRKSGLLKA